MCLLATPSLYNNSNRVSVQAGFISYQKIKFLLDYNTPAIYLEDWVSSLYTDCLFMQQVNIKIPHKYIVLFMLFLNIAMIVVSQNVYIYVFGAL